MTDLSYPSDALVHLAQADPVLSRLIAGYGPLMRERGRPHFYGLARAIIGQQLSVKAAASISARVQALFPEGEVEPLALLALPDTALRGAGLSAAKVLALRDLAGRVADGRLNLAALDAMTDEEVIVRLVEVRGIGRWTAEMFLIFNLGRNDVLSTGDLGVRQALKNLYGLEQLPTPAECVHIAEPWRPYRSVATFYLWHSLSNSLPL